MAAAGFKITFKCLSLCDCFKCDVGFDFPWGKLGGVRNLAGIMFCEASAEVGSAADVALVRMGETTEDVGVVHGMGGLGFLLTRASKRNTLYFVLEIGTIGSKENVLHSPCLNYMTDETYNRQYVAKAE